jgi:hypothetical protein
MPARPPRRRSRLFVVLVVIVVFILIVSVLAVLLIPSAPPVQVADINIYSPDNVCGLNSYPIYYDGFNGSTGQVQTLGFTMPNSNGSACTIRAVTTNTTGFTLSAIQVPLVIPGHGNASMNITVTSPSSAFSGYLNLIMS